MRRPKNGFSRTSAANDYAVLNADNEPCVEIGKRVKSQVLWFSRWHEVERGAFLRGETIVYRDGSDQEIMSVNDMLLKGAHNVENVLAAVCVGMAAGVEPEQIRKAVSQFKAVEHRLEYTATVNGVEYYNDSKATNVDATIKALESFAKGVHLILGGKDKGSPYTVLNDLLHERVKAVYTIGAAASKIEAEMQWRRSRPRRNPGKRGEAGIAKGGEGRRGACSRRRARASTSSRATSIAGGSSRNWFTACKQQEQK